METQQSQYGQNNRDMKTTSPTSGSTSMNNSMNGPSTNSMGHSRGTSTASQTISDMTKSAGTLTDKIRSGVESVQSTLTGNTQVKEQLNLVKSKAQDAYKLGENFVKANPLSAVLGAAALGFVAAALFRGVISED